MGNQDDKNGEDDFFKKLDELTTKQVQERRGYMKRTAKKDKKEKDKMGDEILVQGFHLDLWYTK